MFWGDLHLPHLENAQKIAEVIIATISQLPAVDGRFDARRSRRCAVGRMRPSSVVLKSRSGKRPYHDDRYVLDELLAQSATSPHDVSLLAELLSLLNDGRYPTLELPAQQRRQKTLEALTAQLEALSRSNPVLMVFEDVHWIDPTSLEALGRTFVVRA